MTDATGRYRHLDEMTPWNDRLQSLEVVAVADEAPQVKTFTFRAGDASWFRYRPGQFITLELPTADGPLLRTYTLSSSPSRPLSISVTVKAQPGSIGTQWMFDNLRPGSVVRAYGPAGSFHLWAHPAPKYLFISAGSGVTPMMSMLRWLSDCEPGADVAFVHCARSPRDIIFHDELELLNHRMPSLSVGFFLQDLRGGWTWSSLYGRVDAERLAAMVPDRLEREVFCCGPAPFMDLVRDIFEDAGLDMARYHQESFDHASAIPTPAPAPSPTSMGTDEKAAGTLSVSFTLSETEAECQPGQTVLEAARATGVRIPTACENGVCGTCKTLKISGDVEMDHNGGILDEEIEEGYILACCSRPLGKVMVEA